MKVLLIGNKVQTDAVSQVLTDHEVARARTRKEVDLLINVFKPELAIVVGYSYLLPNSVLNLPRGAVGLHHSLLPEGRGFAPVAWTILNREERAGTTLFKLTKEVDAGDIAGQEEVRVASDETNESLRLKLDSIGLRLITDFLNGDFEWRKQSGVPSYYGKRVPEFSEINWGESAEEVYRLIRASPSDARAFFEVDGYKVYVIDAVIEHRVHGEAGQVVKIDSDGVVIACKRGAIKVKLVEVDLNERYLAVELPLLTSNLYKVV